MYPCAKRLTIRRDLASESRAPLGAGSSAAAVAKRRANTSQAQGRVAALAEPQQARVAPGALRPRPHPHPGGERAPWLNGAASRTAATSAVAVRSPSPGIGARAYLQSPTIR